MPQKDGFTWDAAGLPNPMNGHCFTGVGYTSKGVTIDTWGMLGTHTWAAIAKYAADKSGGEVWVLLTPDVIAAATQRAPNGFDWATLVADFNAMGGNVPVPAPTPTPTPPAPTPAPAATTYSMVCSSLGIVGQPLTVTLTPNGALTGTISVSPSGPAAANLVPQAIGWTGDAASKTVAFTPVAPGALTLTGSDTAGLVDPPPVTPVISQPAPPPNPAGAGYDVELTIRPNAPGMVAGMEIHGTYYSDNNPHRPQGTPISLTYGGRLILKGVLVPLPGAETLPHVEPVPHGHGKPKERPLFE